MGRCPVQLNRTIVSYADMRHFILKMISTSTEKEAEHGGELIGADVERGFIDFARAGRGQGNRSLYKQKFIIL